MLFVFPPIVVVDTEILYGYNFLAPLIIFPIYVILNSYNAKASRQSNL